jgi:hypothetical protein
MVQFLKRSAKDYYDAMLTWKIYWKWYNAGQVLVSEEFPVELGPAVWQSAWLWFLPVSRRKCSDPATKWLHRSWKLLQLAASKPGAAQEMKLCSTEMASQTRQLHVWFCGKPHATKETHFENRFSLNILCGVLSEACWSDRFCLKATWHLSATWFSYRKSCNWFWKMFLC